MTTSTIGRTYSGACFYRSIGVASARLGELYASGLAPSRLHPFEFAILADLSRHAPPTLNELAGVFCMDRSALKYRLRSLEACGFVSIVPDDEDRRARRVHLTESGRAKLEEARPLWLEVQRRFEAAVGQDAATAFRLRAHKVASREFKDDFGSV